MKIQKKNYLEKIILYLNRLLYYIGWSKMLETLEFCLDAKDSTKETKTNFNVR